MRIDLCVLSVWKKMSDPSDVEQYVAGLKVVALREELKKRNLNSTGNKAVLSQRLQEHLEKEASEKGGVELAGDESEPAAKQADKEGGESAEEGGSHSAEGSGGADQAEDVIDLTAEGTCVCSVDVNSSNYCSLLRSNPFLPLSLPPSLLPSLTLSVSVPL